MSLRPGGPALTSAVKCDLVPHLRRSIILSRLSTALRPWLLNDGPSDLKPPRLLPSFAVLDYDINVLEQIDVSQDIAAHGDDVGILPFADGADLIRNLH